LAEIPKRADILVKTESEELSNFPEIRNVSPGCGAIGVMRTTTTASTDPVGSAVAGDDPRPISPKVDTKKEITNADLCQERVRSLKNTM
ncbi:MAG: hypothetical protein QMB23_03330, partial [Candidatus Nanopelagicales bacterium]